jgi:Zn-finger nucleic acid-binding protein
MDPVLLLGMTIQRCTPGCKGLWFRPEDLAILRQDSWLAEHVIDNGPARLGRQYNRIRDIRCPECKSAMDKESDKDQPHIIYESCPNGHGVFLDAGEFTDLTHKTFWDRFKPART